MNERHGIEVWRRDRDLVRDGQERAGAVRVMGRAVVVEMRGRGIAIVRGERLVVLGVDEVTGAILDVRHVGGVTATEQPDQDERQRGNRRENTLLHPGCNYHAQG